MQLNQLAVAACLAHQSLADGSAAAAEGAGLQKRVIYGYGTCNGERHCDLPVFRPGDEPLINTRRCNNSEKCKAWCGFDTKTGYILCYESGSPPTVEEILAQT